MRGRDKKHLRFFRVLQLNGTNWRGHRDWLQHQGWAYHVVRGQEHKLRGEEMHSAATAARRLGWSIQWAEAVDTSAEATG